MSDHPAASPALAPDTSSVERTVMFARCLRCGFEWLPRVPNPKRCPHCVSALWNVPRANKLADAPAPTRKGKARGVAFASGAANPRSNSRRKDKDTPDTP